MSKWNHQAQSVRDSRVSYKKKFHAPSTVATATVTPHPDCFVNPTSHFGTIVNTKIIHDFPTRKSKEKVWRIWVRVRTDAGWVLMGYIGNATKESDQIGRAHV